MLCDTFYIRFFSDFSSLRYNSCLIFLWQFLMSSFSCLIDISFFEHIVFPLFLLFVFPHCRNLSLLCFSLTTCSPTCIVTTIINKHNNQEKEINHWTERNNEDKNTKKLCIYILIYKNFHWKVKSYIIGKKSIRQIYTYN